MNRHYAIGSVIGILLLSMAVFPITMAQPWLSSSRPWAANVIVPQAGAFSSVSKGKVKITGIVAGTVITEQVAVTTLEISLTNTSSARQESELLVPVPDGAVVRSFDFQGPSTEPKAEILPKNVAAGTYHNLVAKIRDPALLEFSGYSLLRSSVFPIDARGEQKVRLTYENLLPADGARIDYVLPRSESLDYCVPWKISVRIKSKTPIQTVYSPSHEIETVVRSQNIVSARLAGDKKAEPGPFRISYLLRRNDVTASFLAYPDTKVGGGYFLMFAGLPGESDEIKELAIKREVTLVIDHSGSMNGPKIDQVKKAAMEILDRLGTGEYFNLIAYNESIEPFSSSPTLISYESRAKAKTWIQRLTATGGTNIYDALGEALRPAPAKGKLPLILFLTDGLPTVGRVSEAAIREEVSAVQGVRRRIFTFGVGTDVNTPLLNWIANDTGGAATFVLNDLDLEAKISSAFKRLSGPVISDPRLAVVDKDGHEKAGVVRDMFPKMHDLFEGDQLVVLGVYQGNQPLTFELSGNYLGRQRKFHFSFDTEKASVQNNFVPRLWASRKIGYLSDAIRQTQLSPRDPKVSELVDEVVRLSTDFGVMTEYTSFLAMEGSDLSSRDAVLRQAGMNFVDRALNVRSGAASVNQEFNNNFMMNQMGMNYRNAMVDQNLNRVSITSVRQVSDQTFYRKNGRWVDSSAVDRADTAKPFREIQFGTQEYYDLAQRLAKEGRQGSLALGGDILINFEGRLLLVRGPATP
jgi:Ca-activated chloride channel family protein